MKRTLKNPIAGVRHIHIPLLLFILGYMTIGSPWRTYHWLIRWRLGEIILEMLINIIEPMYFTSFSLDSFSNLDISLSIL